MIRRVYEQASKAGCSDVYVACSEDEVRLEMEKNGAKSYMTDADLPSGTDRVYAALSKIDPKHEFDVVVNMQGDVPNINPEIISQTIDVLKQEPNCDIATAVTLITDKETQNSPNVVKPVLSFVSSNVARAHYFSRAKVPYGDGEYYEHIGLYAYRRSALEEFVKLPPSNLEKREKLEQLRAIEAGMRIYACEIPQDMKPINVDVIDDLELIRSVISDENR